MRRTSSKKAPITVLGLIGLGIMVTAVAIGRFVPWQDLWMRGFTWIVYRDSQRRKVRLLCDTDHQVLLEACRELLRRVARGDLKPGQYHVRVDRHPVASRFPQAILDLKPTYVWIGKDGRLIMEMLGGLDHFGVKAYPEDFEEPLHSFKYGDKELIPGLWYYDEDYEGNPKYQKKIDELIQKGK